MPLLRQKETAMHRQNKLIPRVKLPPQTALFHPGIFMRFRRAIDIGVKTGYKYYIREFCRSFIPGGIDRSNERNGHKMKNVLVISASPRKEGNSDTLADEFLRGAADAGNRTEKISLADKNIGFCRGCLACQKTGKCVISDDANDITAKMLCADVIVFASPIYFYEMCGQLKTLLDRTNPLYPADYAFRKIYLIATCADSDPDSMDGAVRGICGWLDCFDKAAFSGIIRGTGVNKAGEIKNNADTMKEAYEKGRAV